MVRDELRRLVRFRRHNLVLEPAPPPGETAFDVIACRNVLIYFDAPTGDAVRDALECALAPGGVLLLGTADALGARARGQERPAPAELVPAGPPRPRRASAGRSPARDRRRAPTRDERLARALDAAGEGRPADAVADVAALLRRDPFDADAHFAEGMVELGRAEHEAAVASLRRALFLDPGFGLAAFALGRAHDAAGRADAARSAYARALRTLEPAGERHAAILGQIDLADVAAACRARIQGDSE
jgi:chemotaxis protein methyltransferase CheR